ncbi:MAG: hypothetical protein AB1633_12485, partial [Elusimicrobiota bacterium]
NLDIYLETAEMSDYTNNAGEKKHGWIGSLGLWLINRKYPLAERFYVYPGQTVKWYGYSIYIEDIQVTQEEFKKYEEILRKAKLHNLPPPGTGLGTAIVWVKRDK